MQSYPRTTVEAGALRDALLKVGCKELPDHTWDADLSIDPVSVTLREYSENRRLYLEDTTPLCSGIPELHLDGDAAWLLYEFARFVAATAKRDGLDDSIRVRLVGEEPVFSWGIYALIPQQHGFNLPAMRKEMREEVRT